MNDPFVTCYTNTCTLNPLKFWLFSRFHQDTDGETDREAFGFGFGFSPFCFQNRPKPTDILVKKRKIDRAIFHFRFTILAVMAPDQSGQGATTTCSSRAAFEIGENAHTRVRIPVVKQDMYYSLPVRKALSAYDSSGSISIRTLHKCSPQFWCG